MSCLEGWRDILHLFMHQLLPRTLSLKTFESKAARHPSPLGAQEFKLLEDAAFKVLERVETTKAALAAKGEELAAIRSEYEQKKKEVRCRAVPCCAWGGGAVCWGVYVVSTDE